MIQGAELRGRIRRARDSLMELSVAQQEAIAASKQRLGGSWINISNRVAQKRTLARVNSTPGVIWSHLDQRGGLAILEIVSLRVVDGQCCIAAEIVAKKRGDQPIESPMYLTRATTHGHERMLQRTGDDIETLVGIHMALRRLLIPKPERWLDKRLLLAVGTLQSVLALVDLDGTKRIANIVTVLDKGLLRPDQEELVARFIAREATLEDAVAGGATFGHGDDRE